MKGMISSKYKNFFICHDLELRYSFGRLETMLCKLLGALAPVPLWWAANGEIEGMVSSKFTFYLCPPCPYSEPLMIGICL